MTPSLLDVDLKRALELNRKLDQKAALNSMVYSIVNYDSEDDLYDILERMNRPKYRKPFWGCYPHLVSITISKLKPALLESFSPNRAWYVRAPDLRNPDNWQTITFMFKSVDDAMLFKLLMS